MRTAYMSPFLVFVSFACAALAQSNSPQASTPAPAPATANAPEPGDSTKLEPVKTKKAGYPIAAIQRGIQGAVVLQFDVTEAGDVENIYVLSGNEILAEAEIEALKQWKFKSFIKHGQPTRVTTKQQFDFYFKDKLVTTPIRQYRVDLPDPNSPPSSGSTSNNSQADAKDPKRIRVSQGVSEGLLVHQIAPVYPREARQRGIQGSVVLRAVIGKDGNIKDLKPVSGPQELIDSAMGAVQQWRYKPYMLKGEPVEVDTQITVNYKLGF